MVNATLFPTLDRGEATLQKQTFHLQESRRVGDVAIFSFSAYCEFHNVLVCHTAFLASAREKKAV
jgi:hypothetical protein